MITLKNHTGSISRKGYSVILDPRDNSAFIYAPPTSTYILGIVTERVASRGKCKIATLGEKAKVYVSANVVKGSVIRLGKSTDRVSLGMSTIAKSSDTGVGIGIAMSSGNGLIDCLLTFTSTAAFMGADFLGDDFETVSKNLQSYSHSLTYGVDGIDNIIYDLGGGLSITKTFHYTLSALTSIVLSGYTPSRIELTKTLNYTGVDLTSITYS